MKATGVVRGIDSLGRFVLPKEIRQQFGLDQYAQLEIFMGDGGEIVLKKFSPLASKFEFATSVCEGLSATIACACFVTNDDYILAGSQTIKPYNIGAKILPAFFREVSAGITILNCTTAKCNLLNVVNDLDASITAQMAQPIICDGVCIGTLVAFSKDSGKEFTSADILALQTAAKILGSAAK